MSEDIVVRKKVTFLLVNIILMSLLFLNFFSNKFLSLVMKYGEYQCSNISTRLINYIVSEQITKEITEIQNAIVNGITTYTLKYSTSKFAPKEETLEIDDDLVLYKDNLVLLTANNIEYTNVTDSNPGELAGDGTETTPYLIESIEDLIALSDKCVVTSYIDVWIEIY